MPDHFYPQTGQLKRRDIDAKIDKIKRQRGGSILSEIPLPRTLSLSVLANGEISGYFSTPYVFSITDQKDILLSSLRLIIFNLTFLRSQELIGLEPKNYVASTNAKTKVGLVRNLSHKSYYFSTEYSSFRNQIMDLLKNNMSFIAPPTSDLPENIRGIYQKAFIDKKETLDKNVYNLYNNCNDEEKTHIQKVFSTLIYEYCKIRDKENYLETLFNELKSIITSPDYEV